MVSGKIDERYMQLGIFPWFDERLTCHTVWTCFHEVSLIYISVLTRGINHKAIVVELGVGKEETQLRPMPVYVVSYQTVQQW
jgi:hypothetical protein